MLVDLPRRWRWVLGACCSVVVVIALLFVVFGRPEAPDARVVAAAAAPIVEAATFDVALPEPMLAASATADADAHGTDEVQVCGGAWVKTEADGSLAAAEIERATNAPQTRERIVASLRASGSEFSQASALLLEMLRSEDQQHIADALARRAAGTSDPKVYALAFKVCSDKRAGEGACRLLSAEQWARLDPDNASPWKFILEAASARKDIAAQDDALFHLASARRNETGFFSVAAAVLDAMPDSEATRFATLATVTDAIGFEAATSLSGLQSVITACRDASRDASRAQTCSAVAEVLAERSDTFLDAMIGASLGKRMGWPADRIDRRRGEVAAYLAQMSEASTAAVSDFGCAALDREMTLVRRNAALGEVGAMRAWAAASGKQPEDFIREERSRQQRVEQAAAASAAASNASN